MFYKPCMNAELKDFILKCDICSSYKPALPREPLMPHEIPSRPWQKVGAEKLKMQFSRHCIPEIVISENGPQYTSAKFAKFPSDWLFQHITTSPRNPRSNGKVKSAMKIWQRMESLTHILPP